MNFEEWRNQKFPDGILPGMVSGIDLRECWTAAQFALNSELGVAANEAAKAERRKVALDKWEKLVDDSGGFQHGIVFTYEVDAIIKAAQG